ncbi:hypothetical protein [Peribacillus frigoritolerans]|uniref:hypothetical protein n=1 Tax=Peribacillus frigoritolerans TaxID=450367 RepID=UPI0031E08332
MLAINFHRFLVEINDTRVGQPPSSTPFWEGSVILQIEPSMSLQFGLPILLVREANTDTNAVIWAGGTAPLNTFKSSRNKEHGPINVVILWSFN